MTADPPHIPAGPIDTEPIGFRPSREQEAILRDLLAAAGVELGAYDERIAAWLAGWEWSTVTVIASWIQRAATTER
jgi:cell division protein YceG involved in septum cleavage